MDRDTWREVITAADRADVDLARCDDAWPELRTAYLEMMAANARGYRLRRERWGESIATACRYHGPDSETVTRMRAASAEIARTSAKGESRRLEKAIHRKHEARSAPGDDGERLLFANMRLAGRYGELFMAARVAGTLAEAVEAAADDVKPHVARDAAQRCADVGQVETGRDLYQIYYAAASEQLTGRDDFTARWEAVAMRHRLAEFHLMNGEAARAETLVRTALEALPRLRDDARTRREAVAWSSVQEACRCLLPDCLLVQGRRAEANTAYRAALADFAAIERPTSGEVRTTRLLRNAVVYTSQEWPSPA